MVFAGLPIVAQVRVWDRLCVFSMEVAGGVLEKIIWWQLMTAREMIRSVPVDAVTNGGQGS